MVYGTPLLNQKIIQPSDDHAHFGRFIVEKKTLAGGGFGYVSRGIDTTTGNAVAIKEIRICIISHLNDLVVFRNEIKMGECVSVSFQYNNLLYRAKLNFDRCDEAY